MKVLGIIPARGASKGVPGKNMEVIEGKPLIGYTIEVALKSEVCDCLVVSSDAETILNYAATYPLLIHKRAVQLATDHSPVLDTVFEVLSFAEFSTNESYDVVMLLQPTAPLREAWHLQESIALIAAHPSAASVISVSQTGDIHPARLYHIAEGYLNSLQPESEQLHRQALEPVYLRNGSIYITRCEELRQQKRIMAKPSLAYNMDDKYLLNIDTPRDMLLAKILLKQS